MNRYILGIWDGHDAGAALVDRDAERIVCAVNEERFTRRKLEVGFPARSIEVCLSEAGLSPGDVEQVAVPTFDVAKTLTRALPALKERYYLLRRRKVPPGPLAPAKRWAKYFLTALGPNTLSRTISRRLLARELGRLGLSGAGLSLVPHHVAHAAAAAYTSGWKDALVVTLDGVGDGLSGSLWNLEEGRLRLLSEIAARDSLGIFFEHVTNLLNLRELEDEGKVMALAGYAHPRANGDNPLAALFSVEGLAVRSRLGPIALRRRLARLLAVTPWEDFASMAQAVLEEKTVALFANAVGATGHSRVAYAGGVASNVKVNLLLREIAGLEELFVFPHMGDGGLALGAALWAAAGGRAPAVFSLGDLKLGPRVPPEELEACLRRSGLPATKPSCLEDAAAGRLAAGEILLWFQDRMEYGPRSLGGRSILARPDQPELRDRLNRRLKRRAWYQPFCPSLLEEEAARLLEGAGRGRPDRYMTTAYRVSPEGRRKLAGVIGPDGTCRPQIVGREPSRFRLLLERVRERIGVGALLNTSMNLHGEPMVAGPEDALRTFLSSGAEAMAIEDFLVTPPKKKGTGR